MYVAYCKPHSKIGISKTVGRVYMTGLNKFEKFNRRVSMGIEWVGLAALLLMMLVTTLDVIGSKLFLLPVFGAFDIMMLAQVETGGTYQVANVLDKDNIESIQG